jgi:hypothetical protein
MQSDWKLFLVDTGIEATWDEDARFCPSRRARQLFRGKFDGSSLHSGGPGTPDHASAFAGSSPFPPPVRFINFYHALLLMARRSCGRRVSIVQAQRQIHRLNWGYIMSTPNVN